MKNARFFVLVSVIFFTIAVAASVRAASVSWNGNGSDSLASNAQNWVGGVVPVSGQDLIFSGVGSVAWDLAGTVPASVVSSSTVTLKTPLTVAGGVRLAGGILKTDGYPLNIGGDLQISGGTLTAGNDPINVSGNWTLSSGLASLSASTVTMNGAGDKTITSGGQPFGNLTISASGATISASDDLAVDGLLKITDGRLSLGNRNAAVQGGIKIDGGTLSLGSGTLTLSGSIGKPLSISGGTLAASDSTVEYKPISGSVAVESAAYGNLKLNSKAIFTLNGDASAGETVTVDTGATLSLAGHVLSIPGGDLVNNGAIGDGIIRAPARSLDLLNADGVATTALKASSGTVRIRVEDRDLNRKGDQIETVSGALTITTLGGDRESFNLVETGLATGIFQTANIVVHQGETKLQNGQIEVGQNDIIFVKYADPQDASDTKTIQATVSIASLSASGAPQIISGPRVGNWSSINSGSSLTYSAHIIWETDRDSSSSVSVTSPQLTAPISAGSLTGVTSHDVAVSGLVRGRSYSFTVTSMTAEGKSVTSVAKKFLVIADGDRIKSSSSSAVYWYLGDKRQVFPDFTSYDSWFADWKGIMTIPAEQLADIPLGKVVPVRAGTYLVKIQSDPKTYAVEPFGKLRWIPTEALAINLFGNNWSTRVRDLDVSQFANYEIGDPLAFGEAPSGFIYRMAGGQWNAVVERTTHQLSDLARSANGLSSRFVSAVVPSAVSALTSGGEIGGYEPSLSGVVADGSAKISAPAFGS